MNPTAIDPVLAGNEAAEQEFAQNAATLPSNQALSGIAGNVSQAQQDLQPVQANPSTTVAPHTSLLDRLLPTIGGIGGGLLAGGLDVATGGLAIPFDAALAGGGAALGKLGENALTHQNLSSGLLASGLEGAVGQGVGEGVGSLLGAGGKFLQSTAADQIAKEAVQNDASAAAQEAQRIGTEFGAVKPGQANVGQALNITKDLGVKNPTAQDMVNIGNTYTGSNPETGDGVLNFYKNQVLDQAGGTVDLNGSMDQLHNTLAQPENQILGGEEPVTSAKGQLPKAPTNTATKIVNQFRNMLPSPSLDEGGQISEQLAPKDAQDLLKSVGEQINQTTPKPNLLGVIPEEQQAENNVWRGLYQNVRNALYNRPEVDQAVQSLQVGPDEEAVIDDAIKSNGITDPQVATNVKADLIGKLNGAQSANDLLQSEAPMVNVSKVGTIAKSDFENNPQVPKSVKSGVAQANGSKPNILGTGLNLGGAYEALVKGNPIGMLPALAYDVSKSPTALNGIGGILGKVGGSALPVVAGQVAANSPNDVAGPAGATNGAINVPGGQTVNPQSSVLGQTLNQDLTAGQEALIDPYLAGNYSPQISQLSTLLPMVQKLNAAQAAEQNLGQYFNAAGGAQGPVGGLLTRLGSVFTGGPAASYGAQAGQAGQTIANALGVPASEVATPQITQNKTAAQAAINNIQNLIQSLELGNQAGVLSQ